jgi:hypothetical protein
MFHTVTCDRESIQPISMVQARQKGRCESHSFTFARAISLPANDPNQSGYRRQIVKVSFGNRVGSHWCCLLCALGWLYVLVYVRFSRLVDDVLGEDADDKVAMERCSFGFATRRRLATNSKSMERARQKDM